MSEEEEKELKAKKELHSWRLNKLRSFERSKNVKYETRLININSSIVFKILKFLLAIVGSVVATLLATYIKIKFFPDW